MNNGKVYLTSDGYQKIKADLDQIQNKTRPKVVERLALARAQGDLSENNEYAAAREELAFIDGRIEELEDVVKNAEVIKEKNGKVGNVGLGCKVTVKTAKGENFYYIVGEWEADPSQKKVSHSSPLGKALMGKAIGEEVEFEAPAGKIFFKVVKIE